MAPDRDQHVPSATNLPTSASADLSHRQRNYMISMAIRTVCFVLGVVLHGPIRWVCFALAIVLPYVAVVAANATNRRSSRVRGRTTPIAPQERLEQRWTDRHDESV